MPYFTSFYHFFSKTCTIVKYFSFICTRYACYLNQATSKHKLNTSCPS